MGFSIRSSLSDPTSLAHYRTHKLFLVCNYIILGTASSCIFLTLSLRLIPSACGFLLILLHALTIVAAIAGSAASSSSSNRWYGAHMISTVLAAILQGSVAVLIFTRTMEFLFDGLKSYVRQEDGEIILKMVGSLCVAIFCFEWVVMAMAFVLRYYGAVVDTHHSNGSMRSAKVMQGEEMSSSWPYPLQV